MDIRNNKNIKHFTLKAIASAILTLNAESVMASCPVAIYGNSLADTICNFDAHSSVTVEKGGTVGGILMNGYQPTDSFITIDSGGSISKTGIGIGINIQSSSLSNGLTNNGMISTSATAISLSNNSTVSGGISNNGTISSTSRTAISIFSSTIVGNLSNNGTISGGSIDEGITLSNSSSISGSIINNGLIRSDSGNGLIMRSNSMVSGGISNSGLVSGDAFGINIFNSSTIQGNISNSGIISGDLQDGVSIHNDAIVGGSIINNGIMRGGDNGLSIYSDIEIGGNISNSGIISGGTSGIYISSSATVSGGISNSGIIQGDTFAINISNSTVNNIDILGKSARIIGAVNAADTDVNITNGAQFTSEGTYTVNNFNIAQNAVFNMANAITVANAVNNSGTLAVSDSLQTIAGNYTQNSGGIFQTGVSSASNYGQLFVNGTADLSQSGDMYVQVKQHSLLHGGDVLSDVISGNTFITPNSDFNVSDNSYIWKFSAALNNANNGVDLTATINPTAYNVCQGAYCQGAADTIIGQVAAGNPLFAPYATLATALGLQQAASQATPELNNENIQIIQLITRAVIDIVPMWSNLRGKSVGGAMLYQPGKIWIKPYGTSMTQDERNTVDGFTATAYGAVIGKDIELSNSWLFGGAVAAGADNIHGKSVLSGQSIDSNAYQVMLYGAKKFPSQLYFAGQGLIGYETNDSNRSIPLYVSTATASYNSWFTNIRAEAGWNSYAFTPNLVFTPEIDASYLFIKQGSYQESGSAMDLAVAANDNSSLVLGAYCNGAYHLTTLKNQRDLALTGYAGVAGDVLNSQPHVTATFVAGGSSFSTFGVQFNGLVFRGGVGLTLTSQTSPLIVQLNYDLQAGNNAYSGIGAATIKYLL